MLLFCSRLHESDPADLECGREQAALHKLLQDEDVGHFGYLPDAVWGHPQCLQPCVRVRTMHVHTYLGTSRRDMPGTHCLLANLCSLLFDDFC